MTTTSRPAGATDGGVLVLAATPIGDPADASARLRELLAAADVIAAEDTRRTQRLCAALEITPRGRLLSYHEHNEAARTAQLVEALRSGQQVAVVTDAGMPSVSDPGYRLVSAAIAEGVRVTAVPGPSAVLTALAISGLPVDRFCFEGFLPRKEGERARALENLADEPRTMVFFESARRLAATLTAMSEAFGAERPAAVCRELTKTYEEVVRGGVAELAEWAQEPPRGEITLVVSGADRRSADPAVLLARVSALVEQGVRLKDACKQVAAQSGGSVKELYAAMIAIQNGPQ